MRSAPLLRLSAVLLAALLASCASGPKPAPEPASTAATATTTDGIGGNGSNGGNGEDRLLDRAREEIDALLEMAQAGIDAAAPRDAEACEIAALAALGRWGDRLAANPEFTDYAGMVIDELDLLEAQRQPVTPGLEPPPELQPVAAERVAEALAAAQAERFDLPVVVQPEVASLIDYYTGPRREWLVAALERAGRWLPMIRSELTKADLPLDLAWLPLVESAFHTHARSRARAQGMWQFMAGTARLYDLRVDGVVDERNDPYLATPAAVAHLSDLQKTFGDWELALAAYNSGAGRVQRALKRGKGATDFWSLRRHLPRETRNYVPGLWALLVVAKNPTAYGLPAVQETTECRATVPVDGALDLEVLAERSDLDREQLGALNPALLRGITPVKGTYDLAVPCGTEQKAALALASIPPDQRVRKIFHTVKRGDTLGAIARRYGSSVDTIAGANNIRNPRALRVGQTLVIPRYPTSGRAAPVRSASVTPAKTLATGGERQAAPDRYVVRSGDTLYDIARRYGVPLDELKRRNGLSGNLIKPGDVLLMP
jgi:membrane-bound lytic murein transglycosylase D